ncbi:hypothetical protein DCCM_0110 [Desulfocucumis palustris]|uniref:TIGR04076 family protein n=1 Tax=Desulfocucumis palustris TaxID=1898651 RepID=A0A2L2XCI2_9FIRM|nr:TIGR04076 family protein [Desulfocucumis palustris]GBF31926.1 hypothetical protein DCCM_0110 [Desulfocucumis palustris]
MEKVIIEVVSSGCKFYKPGDRIYIDGALVDKEKSANLCMMALQSFFPFVYAFRKGVTAEQMGFGDKVTLQCPDYCAPVIFELKKDE